MVDLSVFTTVKSLREELDKKRGESTISFVPTMGALHHGHLALVKHAQSLADIVVVSIFVNPTQFNNTDDLAKYPRTLDKDIEKLEELGDVIVFTPTVEEVYPQDFKGVDLPLGHLNEVMEGKFRPGHFEGMMNVVKRFFDIVEPDIAIFGEKDYQQLAIIRYMTKALELPIQIVGHDTIRESSGLASSSRNVRLTESQQKDAEIIRRTIDYAKSLSEADSVEIVRARSMEHFNNGNLELEYLEIVHPDTLESIDEWVVGARMCIAAYCGDVRLIDNGSIFD